MQLLKVVQQAVLVAALLEIVEAVGQDDPELREVVHTTVLNVSTDYHLEQTCERKFHPGLCSATGRFRQQPGMTAWCQVIKAIKIIISSL